MNIVARLRNVVVQLQLRATVFNIDSFISYHQFVWLQFSYLSLENASQPHGRTDFNLSASLGH